MSTRQRWPCTFGGFIKMRKQQFASVDSCMPGVATLSITYLYLCWQFSPASW